MAKFCDIFKSRRNHVKIYLRMKKLLLLLILFHASLIYSQDIYSDLNYKKKQWVDSIYKQLTLDEKIGQLFMPMVFTERDSSHYNDTYEF